jgi:hypothetical protein
MSATFKSLVLSVCLHGDALQSAALALKARAKTMSYTAFVNASAVIIGEQYGVEPHPSRKGGLLTFTKDTAAQQKHKAILKLHPGKPVQKSEPVVIRERVVGKAVATAAQAVAGMSRAEFNEFMRQMRDAVTFA